MSSRRDQENKNISNAVIRELDDATLKEAKLFIIGLLDFRKKKKLYDTYIIGTKEALNYNGVDKIFLEYRIDGTVTGRLSNAGMDGSKTEKMGISFHTLPRDTEYNIRSYVVAPKGYKFITADMKAMELRILAHLSRDSNMSKAFRDKEDLHTYSAAMTFSKDRDKITKEERQIAKEVSFLTVYGGTENTLAQKRGISEKKAKKIIDSWMNTFYGIPMYMKHVHKFIKTNAYAYTIFGRRRNLPNIRSEVLWIRDESLRQGLNFTVQSASSDALVCCLLGINAELKNKKLDAWIAGTVHDSVEIICHESLVTEVVGIIKHHMIHYPYIKENFGFEFSVPLEIDIEVGDSFGSGEKI